MDTAKQLSGISTRLNELLEDMERVMDYIDNSELYNEINSNVYNKLEIAISHLDIAIDDIEDGMYENAPEDEGDFEEWD